MSIEPPCDTLADTPFGRAPLVVDEFGCRAELVQVDTDEYPALVVATADDEVVLRSGSEDQPINLAQLQRQVGGSFSKMMVQDFDGNWYVFSAPDTCVTQRLLIKDGVFIFEDDVMPSLIESNMCPIDACDEFDFLVGLRLKTIMCDGVANTFYEPVLVPKNLCPTCD